MTVVPRRRPLVVAAGAFLLVAACTNGGDRPDVVAQAKAPSSELVAQVASYDLVAGRSGRFIVGLFGADKTRLLAFGTVEFSFAFLGDRSSTRSVAEPRFSATAGFLPIPGQRLDPSEVAPRFAQGSEAIGVYGAPEVRFDRPGFWQVDVATTVEGKARRADAAFEVLARSAIPAVGGLAPVTEHPVAGAAGVDPRSVDSRARIDVAIPDPELHRTTIAAALAAKRPLVVVVSTPTYCQSRFCGPITDSVATLAHRYGDRAAFVHLEVWRDFEKKEMNEAAAEWIYPPGTEDAREPWVFVVGADGRITHRFDNVATDTELEAARADVLR